MSCRRSRPRLSVLLSAITWSSLASAVTQPTPDGQSIPVPVIDGSVNFCFNKNVGICLDREEGSPGLIDAQADALIAPELFQPTCKLTFTPITKGGHHSSTFGWYNLKPDPQTPGQYLAPEDAELHEMFSFPTGFLDAEQMSAAYPAKALDLEAERQLGHYTGGEIAFYLTSADGSNAFFTQHALNDGSVDGKTYYQVLTWQSVAHEDTFYFGWEDDPAKSGGDNDFDDLMFSVSGVQCSGGGEICDTGQPGACAGGTMQCRKGQLECVQSIPPSAERCNALDDDCNGDVDEGNLCDVEEICFRGRCVPACGTGEFRCAGDLVCESGVCIEEACVEVTCPAGQVCADGECIDACSGIVCPHARVCRNGGCVDPCQGIECDAGFSCVLGVCQSCACSACHEGQVCSQNLCVDAGCETQSCAPGTHCVLGACVDDCGEAVCPAGQRCSAGDCVPDPRAGSGGGSGTGGSGGIVIQPVGGSGTFASGGSAGVPGSDAEARSVRANAGCGCALPAGRSSAAGSLLALAGIVLFGRRFSGRRRRSRD